MHPEGSAWLLGTIEIEGAEQETNDASVGSWELPARRYATKILQLQRYDGYRAAADPPLSPPAPPVSHLAQHGNGMETQVQAQARQLSQTPHVIMPDFWVGI
ncbi:hypothetical protein HYFRA_00007717 [Hymenoscyphus fraxineus]|uniref:Uncharacterized protein n=1 Tax=Hymenoscyphus fraxineus TaxID=746836 RepID=A0A9N9KP09_9HELO|nr:hypothetical protein HYFRA_00007717 [Hymenoscyphus fraxineus]